jgi:hypothetical protein
MANELLVYDIKVHYGEIADLGGGQTFIEFVILACDETDLSNMTKILEVPGENESLQSIFQAKIGTMHRLFDYKPDIFESHERVEEVRYSLQLSFDAEDISYKIWMDASMTLKHIFVKSFSDVDAYLTGLKITEISETSCNVNILFTSNNKDEMDKLHSHVLNQGYHVYCTSIISDSIQKSANVRLGKLNISRTIDKYYLPLNASEKNQRRTAGSVCCPPDRFELPQNKAYVPTASFEAVQEIQNTKKFEWSDDRWDRFWKQGLSQLENDEPDLKKEKTQRKNRKPKKAEESFEDSMLELVEKRKEMEEKRLKIEATRTKIANDRLDVEYIKQEQFSAIGQDMLLEQKIARLRQSFKRLHRRRRADPFDDEGFLRMQKELKIIAKEMLKEKYKLLREKQRKGMIKEDDELCLSGIIKLDMN